MHSRARLTGVPANLRDRHLGEKNGHASKPRMEARDDSLNVNSKV
jgi:hypothetical protein